MIQKFRRNPVFLIHFVLWLLLVFKTVPLIAPAMADPSFGIVTELSDSKTAIKIQDFSFIHNFVQKAWLHQTTVDSGHSIYSPENHLKVTSDWAGTKVGYSLHFGYSPTMLWVLAPLAPFSHSTAYILFDAAGLLAIFWITQPSRCRWGIGLISFFSELARRCLIVGQTVLLTGAGLLFLAQKSRDDGHGNTWRQALVPGAVLWALTAKPPIALTAGAVLLALLRWRILVTAAALTILSTVISAPLMGAHWMSDYVRLIVAYNQASAGPIFAWAIRPEYMVNLRAILSVNAGIPDDAAGIISASVWLFALAIVVLAGLRGLFRAEALWSMSILSYLLFCPHVTSTEELLLVVLLPLLVPLGKKLSWHELVLFFTLPLLPSLSPLEGPFYGKRLPIFIVQLCLLVMIAATAKWTVLRPAREVAV